MELEDGWDLKHVFEMRVLEKYPDDNYYEIGLIKEDDDAQLWQAWGSSNNGKRSFIGGYTFLHRAYDAVQERWLTEPAHGWLMVWAAERLFSLKVGDRFMATDAWWVPVACMDATTGVRAEAIVSAELSVPALLAQDMIRDAIASAYRNATEVRRRGLIVAPGKLLTDAEKAAIRLTRPATGT